MSADEHLNSDQFSVWYHGTRSSEAAKIRESGLITRDYSRHNPTVTAEHQLASGFASWKAHGHPGETPAVVTFHVPHSEEHNYLQDPMARDSGLIRPLPKNWVQ